MHRLHRAVPLFTFLSPFIFVSLCNSVRDIPSIREELHSVTMNASRYTWYLYLFIFVIIANSLLPGSIEAFHSEEEERKEDVNRRTRAFTEMYVITETTYLHTRTCVWNLRRDKSELFMEVNPFFFFFSFFFLFLFLLFLQRTAYTVDEQDRVSSVQCSRVLVKINNRNIGVTDGPWTVRELAVIVFSHLAYRRIGFYARRKSRVSRVAR